MSPFRNTVHGGPPSPSVTTSFLVANLHCPTCVSAIRRVVHDLSPSDVKWVSPNIVTSVVTVEHNPVEGLIRVMMGELKDAGFEVHAVSSSDEALPLGSRSAGMDGATESAAPDGRSKGAGKLPEVTASYLTSPVLSLARKSPSSQAKAHLENCAQCRAKSHAPNDKCPLEMVESTSKQTESERGPLASIMDKSQLAGAHVKPIKSFVTVDDSSLTQPTWRATFAVGGMTCAVCVNAITDELKKADWISKATVNLLSNSATVELTDKAKAEKVVDMIEDLGYEAAIDSVVQVEEEAERGQERTVEIRIEGLYCEHCPGRVIESISGFRQNLNIITPPTIQRPIMTLNYIPEAPAFTIRQILAAVEACDPAFSAAIYHPPTLEERSKEIQRRHQRQILYRVIFAGIVCIPTFVLGIVYMSLLPDANHTKHFLMMPWTSGISRAQMALFIMATPVYFFGADAFHVRAVKEIRALWRRGSRTPVLQRFYRFGSMNTLMSLGTTIAYISSVSQLIAAAVYQPKEVSDSNFYFDSVVFLTFFLLVGRLIEAYSKAKTGDAVEMLGKLRPTTATLVEKDPEKGDVNTVVKADQLDFGDIVRVPHGSSPPADGVVVQGETDFDESSLTGESRLVKKVAGDEVFSGTVNKDAPIRVRITSVSGTSMLDQIVAVVREGQTKRAPIEQLADLLTMYFVPGVTLAAIITWVTWLLLGTTGAIPGHYLDVTSGGWVAFSLQFAIAVFVVACPCGIGLAAPTAIFVGSGMAARMGILAKGGGEAFEKASRVDCVVFDKTGTLTVGGQPTITDSELFPDQENVDEKKSERLLAALKAVEDNSSHPIAKAVVAFCEEKGTDLALGEIEDLQEIPGKGMKAVFRSTQTTDSFEILVGNEALMKDFSAECSSRLSSVLEKWKQEAKSIALAATRPIPSSSPPSQDPSAVVHPYTMSAALSISDPIRPESAAVVAALRAGGKRVYMLSGDNATTAAAVATRVGIDPANVIAGVLPAQKAARIQALQASLHAKRGAGTSESTVRRATIAMVGDGVNDSPALAQSDVGIAIGSGSDVAIGTAEFVLVMPRLDGVLALLDLSRAVFRRIKFNFGWALVYNMLAVPVAAGAFYAIKTGPGGTGHVRLDPVWASLAMALSSVSVVCSSLALRTRIPGIGFRLKKMPGV